ncbi:MAG: NCS2 family permease [Gammaproteobacteria bacterium]|nr:NCS2 family permease [Gammaproteobacteria bacterium]
MNALLERFFHLSRNNTNIRQEVVAGWTTFLAMAYIAAVNPLILADAGMPQESVFVATCLAAAFGTLLMGVLANYPIALAPGMGLNAFFTYGVVLGMGYSWQQALGAVLLSGGIFVLLSVSKLRETVINAIPAGLKIGIAAGIGLFLGLIGLKNAGIVVNHDATLVTLGDIKSIPVLLALLGFALIVALEARKIRGAVIIAVLAVTGLGLLFDPAQTFKGIVSMPPSVAPTFMALEIPNLFDLTLWSVVFALLFVDLFDTAGTLTAVAHKGKMLDAQGRLPRMGRALLADSTATVVGSVMGTSSTTSYIESATGVVAGGRTGLTAVVVSVLFLLLLFFSPLASMVPAYATAGALMYVATLMLGALRELHWDDLTEAVPAAITALLMPFAFSIAHAIALGILAYVVIKVGAGRWRDVGPVVWVLALLFIVKYALA